MFTTLVESGALRTRSARGAALSVSLHGAVIAFAVSVSLPNRMNATPEPKPKSLVYVAAPSTAMPPATPRPPSVQRVPTSAPTLPTIVVPTFTPPTLPPVDWVSPVIPPEFIVMSGAGTRTGSPTASVVPGMFTPGGVVDVADVERVPRILGRALEPRYPGALRERGVVGHVVLRFVVDTLGRAELDGVVVAEATHTLFADAVKNVLGVYEFSPGEVGGRKVRTLVQLPFTFALRP